MCGTDAYRRKPPVSGPSAWPDQYFALLTDPAVPHGTPTLLQIVDHAAMLVDASCNQALAC